jgi:HAD superfamily hydrolase (TIGR01484 family)
MNRYQLLALDVDGTLVEGANGTISPRVVRAIQAVSQKLHVILCTGRDAFECDPIVGVLGLQGQYRILGGGSSIVSPDGRVELTGGIDNRLVARAIELVGSEPLTSFQLTPDGWEGFRPNKDPLMLSFQARGPSHARLVTTLLQPLADRLYITEVTDTEHPERVNVHLSALGVSKGTALARLRERLGVSKEQVISVGDMPIDLPMFRESGLGVAMGNAPESVKQGATIIAPSLAEDGVAFIIEKYLLSA